MTKVLSLVGSVVMLACGSAHERPDAGDVPDGEPPDRDTGVGGFTGAFVAADCAPDDGAALTLLLFTVAVPECSAEGRLLRFYVFEGSSRFFPIEPGETITSSGGAGGFGNGTAELCSGEGPCVTTNDWSLTFDVFERDSRAAGRYSVLFADGTTADGTFDADWCMPAPLMCG